MGSSASAAKVVLLLAAAQEWVLQAPVEVSLGGLCRIVEAEGVGTYLQSLPAAPCQPVVVPPHNGVLSML